MPSSGGSNNSSLARRCVHRLLQVRTAADSLPIVLFSLVTNGKTVALALLVSYIVLVFMWLPFWLLSFVVTEWGIYMLAVATIVFCGRCIIRLIAFPGASQKVTAEVETEFAKYSVRILDSAATSFIEVASVVSAASGAADQPAFKGMNTYELPLLWRRAKTFRNRVIAVYLDVLIYLYQEPTDGHGPPNNVAQDITRYGNNRLSGDVGDLSDLTSQAKTDGRELMEKLRRLLQLVDTLEQNSEALLESDGTSVRKPITSLSKETGDVARQLLESSNEFRDFLSSLKPTSSDDEEVGGGIAEEDLTVDAIRQKFEDQGASAMNTLKAGMASIIPMLDPPPHTSIFGFDVQRGCMLSRYRGARQLWVKRPTGGMIDVLHFPAKQKAPDGPIGSTKAVLYCNPNAGLIEVATGMSLVGGNVPSADSDNSPREKSWVDYYTDLGLDVYVFNYAGYGRSYGTTMCLSGNNTGSNYHTDTLSRIRRIVRLSFCTFSPTPDSLRADGITVAQHLLNDIGVQKLIVHGESIGGIAASGTVKFLSGTPNSNKVLFLLCDRTFCNLEAVAQRLVGGWSGYAIRALAPFWNTDVAGDFLAVSCPKIVANDVADMVISDTASLKSGIALSKEIHRGLGATKGIGWVTETPLQYRMADWENCCVNDSKYVAPANLFQAQAPTWPADKHITLEEAFHFAACCKRIGKLAKEAYVDFRSSGDGNDEEGGIELNNQGEISTSSSQPLIMEAWKMLSCCDGLTGAVLGSAVKQGFDATVAWLCSCLIFGGQTVVAAAEHRLQQHQQQHQAGKLEVCPADFDGRPSGYQKQEQDGVFYPKPIPEVVDKLKNLMDSADEMMAKLTHELQFILGVLEYVLARLSAPSTVESASKSRHVQRFAHDCTGSFLNLHCGHNNAFSKTEKQLLKTLIEEANTMSSTTGQGEPMTV